MDDEDGWTWNYTEDDYLDLEIDKCVADLIDAVIDCLWDIEGAEHQNKSDQKLAVVLKDTLIDYDYGPNKARYTYVGKNELANALDGTSPDFIVLADKFGSYGDKFARELEYCQKLSDSGVAFIVVKDVRTLTAPSWAIDSPSNPKLISALEQSGLHPKALVRFSGDQTIGDNDVISIDQCGLLMLGKPLRSAIKAKTYFTSIAVGPDKNYYDDPQVLGIAADILSVHKSSLEFARASHANESLFSEHGIFDFLSSFEGFDAANVFEEARRLPSDYKNFSQDVLGAFALNSTLLLSGKAAYPIEDETNSIYFPSDLSPCTTSINEWSIVQIARDGTYLLAEYLSHYLNSELGRKIRRAVFLQVDFDDLGMPRVACLNLPIAVPNIEDQKAVIEVQRLIAKTKDTLTTVEARLALNPMSAKKYLERLGFMYKAAGVMSDEELIRQLIREGESKKTEFKETWSWDVKTKQKASHVIDSSLKAIAAFLNTDGGHLLIGVRDDGTLSGMETEIGQLFKNEDSLALNFKDIFISRFSFKHMDKLSYRFVSVGNVRIFVVDCQNPNCEPVVLDEKFYVRLNPAVKELKGDDLVTWMQRRSREGHERRNLKDGDKANS